MVENPSARFKFQTELQNGTQEKNNMPPIFDHVQRFVTWFTSLTKGPLFLTLYFFQVNLHH